MDERYGKLTVIESAGRNKYGMKLVKCLCECGVEVVVTEPHLKSGCTKSCGCLRREVARTINLSHGMAGTRLYGVWCAMKRRCYNNACSDYPDYGGRGIVVCEQWKESFELFEKWAVETGYRSGLTIERKDVNGNYEPANCCWATRREQTNNTRRNVRLTAYGEEHTVAEWAKITGLKDKTIYQRVKRGATGELALLPLRGRNRR